MSDAQTVIVGDGECNLQNDQRVPVTEEQYVVKLSLDPLIKSTHVAKTFLWELAVTIIKVRSIEFVNIPNQWKMFMK
eukprot:3623662-Ditylum_brightwellii.AAC.1